MISLYSEESSEFYDLFFSTVDNGGKYPGSFTKKENELIMEFAEGRILHLFSGSSKIGHVRIDFNHENATHHMDVFDYLKDTSEQFDTIILDPPYNKRFADKYNELAGGRTKQFVIFAESAKTTLLFNHLIRLKPKKIIIKSWNWYVPRGYAPYNCFLCYAGGFRKPTILMKLIKKEIIENEN